jgi:hypothetical protein
MNKQIKKVFLTSIILLMGISSCGGNSESAINNINDNVYAASSSYPTYGTKTSSTHTVTMYHNQEGGDIYALAYIEDGVSFADFCSSIGKRLTITVQGYTKNNSSNYGWFYDEWGVNAFDATVGIREDISLWSYMIPKNNAPAIQDIVSNKTYSLTWNNGKGSSFVGVDETLPYYANEGDVIEFKLAYSYYAQDTATVKIDNTTLNPNDEGIYSFTVSGNHIISASDIEEDSNTSEINYYLSVNGTKYKMVKNAGNANEYMITGVNLQKGDEVTIVDNKGYLHNAIKNSGLGDFTSWSAPYEGSYDFYFDYVNDYTYVGIPTDPNASTIDVYFHNTNGWSEVYYYTWGTNGYLVAWPGTKISSFTTGYYKVTIDLTLYNSIIFHNNKGTQTSDLSLAGCSSGVMFDCSSNKSTYSA